MENMKNTKITRKIGETYVDFELTDAEMESAFTEYQFQCDVIEVKARLKESGEYENWEEIPCELIEDLARTFRNEMMAIMDGMGDGRIPAMESVFKKYENDLEQYKLKYKLFSKEVTLTMTKVYTIKAKSQEEADRIFDVWSDRHGNDMCDDLTEDVRFNGDWDYGYTYEEDDEDPEYADISEEDV